MPALTVTTDGHPPADLRVPRAPTPLTSARRLPQPSFPGFDLRSMEPDGVRSAFSAVLSSRPADGCVHFPGNGTTAGRRPSPYRRRRPASAGPSARPPAADSRAGQAGRALHLFLDVFPLAATALLRACLRLGRSRGVMRRASKVPGVPDDAGELRTANARLRELLAERMRGSPGRTRRSGCRGNSGGLAVAGRCIRPMVGAREFCAIRSYLATTARHGIGALDAITRAFQGRALDPRNRINTPEPRRRQSRARTGTCLSSCSRGGHLPGCHSGGSERSRPLADSKEPR